MIAPMPRLSEKKAWPRAARITLPSTTEKSGLSRKARPKAAQVSADGLVEVYATVTNGSQYVDALGLGGHAPRRRVRRDIADRAPGTAWP